MIYLTNCTSSKRSTTTTTQSGQFTSALSVKSNDKRPQRQYVIVKTGIEFPLGLSLFPNGGCNLVGTMRNGWVTNDRARKFERVIIRRKTIKRTRTRKSQSQVLTIVCKLAFAFYLSPFYSRPLGKTIFERRGASGKIRAKFSGSRTNIANESRN